LQIDIFIASAEFCSRSNVALGAKSTPSLPRQLAAQSKAEPAALRGFFGTPASSFSCSRGYAEKRSAAAKPILEK
jgi:hypothetical protein